MLFIDTASPLRKQEGQFKNKQIIPYLIDDLFLTPAVRKHMGGIVVHATMTWEQNVPNSKVFVFQNCTNWIFTCAGLGKGQE